MSSLQQQTSQVSATHESLPTNKSVETFTVSHRQFIMNTSIITAILMVVGFGFSLSKFFSNNPDYSPGASIMLVIAGLVFVMSWFFAKNGQERLGGWLLVFGMLGTISQTLVFSNFSVIILISLLTVCIGGLILLGTKAAYGFTALSSLFIIIATSTDRLRAFNGNLQDPSKPGFTDIFFLIILFFIIVWLTTYLAKSFNHANERLQHQASRLQLALADIEEKRALGEDVSRQVFALTAELNAIASQQASGSQQQASALTQVTVSLEEMTATAQAIANKTSLLSKAAYDIKEITNRVSLATVEVSRVGKNGAIAVENTIKGNERVREVHSNLQEILSELAKQQGQIKEVVTAIRGISDETQLLSLNAAIEAAGAGEYGERFGVVAAEVKALAERSILASRQVNGILGQVEQYIQDASLAAESGHREIQNALTTAQQSGQVISELMSAIQQTGQEIMEIDTATSVMSEQSREITVATNQQYNASSAALENLQSIGTIATQNANGSNEVTKTTHNLEKLSHNLLKTLIAEKMSSNSIEFSL